MSPDRRLADAVLSGDLDGVVRALHEGASPDAQTPGGWPVLVAASADRRTAVVAALLDAGASTSVAAPPDHTALHAAAASGATEVIELLLRRGADASARDGAGRTPLHVGVLNAPPVVVRALEAASPDLVRVADEAGRSPVDDARSHPASRALLDALGEP